MAQARSFTSITSDCGVMVPMLLGSFPKSAALSFRDECDGEPEVEAEDRYAEWDMDLQQVGEPDGDLSTYRRY